MISKFPKLNKMHPRDIIGIIVVIGGMILMSIGINHLVSGIVIMVVTWYFARRLEGEGNGNISRKEVVIVDKQGRKLGKEEVEEINKKIKAAHAD